MKKFISTKPIAAVVWIIAGTFVGSGAEKLPSTVVDDNVPVRRGGVEGRPYWNGHAIAFMYPPAFDFKRVDGAAKYRFDVLDDVHERFSFLAEAPDADLSSVWPKLRVGYVTVTVTAVDAAGKDLAEVGRRTFWRKAAFKEGVYPKARYDYSVCAGMMYDNLFNRSDSQHLLKTGRLAENFENRYPSKMLSRLIIGMVQYGALRPDCRDRALAMARAGADYLLSVSEKADARYPYLPPTYNPAKYAANPAWPQRRTCMTIYPIEVADAFLTLGEATGETKYLDASKRIAETYLRMQGEDGTWPLMVDFDKGPVGKNRLVPIEVAQYFGRLANKMGDARFRAAGDRAFAYVENTLIATWNWEGQFEDTPPTDRYRNLTQHGACSTAIYLLKRYPDNAAKRALARELLRFSEDLFVNWERPYDNGRRVPDKTKFTGYYNRFWALDKWITPSVVEQYGCFAPVDGSAAKLIFTYLAFYRLEGNPVDLAKARALGDTATRCTSPDGLEATWWSEHELRVDIWPNCMFYTATALAELALVVGP